MAASGAVTMLALQLLLVAHVCVKVGLLHMDALVRCGCDTQESRHFCPSGANAPGSVAGEFVMEEGFGSPDVLPQACACQIVGSRRRCSADWFALAQWRMQGVAC